MRSADEIRALCDAATPGPWYVDTFGGYIEDRQWQIPNVLRDRYGNNAISSNDEATIQFIAAARELVPDLLARIEAVEALAVEVENRMMATAKPSEIRAALDLSSDSRFSVAPEGTQR